MLGESKIYDLASSGGKKAYRWGKKAVQQIVAQTVKATTTRRKPFKAAAKKRSMPSGSSAGNSGRRRGRRRNGRGKGGHISQMPISVSGASHAIQYEQIGNPRHKEWGSGVRIQGTDILGNFVVPSNTASSTIFTSTTTTYADSTPTTGYMTYYDLYTSVLGHTPGLTTGQDYADLVMSLHPAFISRLARETQNWGRYVFRRIEIFNEPISNTTEPVGYVVAMGHNTVWPLNDDQFQNLTPFDVMELDIRASGAFYEPFSLKAGDYDGDRTWPCSIPVIFTKKTADPSDNTVGVPSGDLTNFVNDFYQFYWVVRMASDGTGSVGVTAGFRGFVYVRYVIDFYARETNATDYITPLYYLPVSSTSSLSSSSSSGSMPLASFSRHHGYKVSHPCKIRGRRSTGPALTGGRPALATPLSKPGDSYASRVGISPDVPTPPEMERKKSVWVDKDGPVEISTPEEQKVLRRYLHYRKTKKRSSSKEPLLREKEKEHDSDIEPDWDLEGYFDWRHKMDCRSDP